MKEKDMPDLLQRWMVISFLCLGLAVPGYAANTVFMSVIGPRGPIQGDPKSPHGSQWIPVLEIDESIITRPDAVTGKSMAREQPPIKIVKQVDAASPELRKTEATGGRLKEVVFQLYRNNAGKDELYETIRLTEAIIAGIQNRGGSSMRDTRQTEEISFQCAKIEITYAQQLTSITKPPDAVKPSTSLPR